jgi:fumarate hydratase class II
MNKLALNCSGKTRIEKDSMGEIHMPLEAYWGAQTQRSFENFNIGQEKMPYELLMAFVKLKKAAAQANFEIGVLTEVQKNAIAQACDEILEGHFDDHFPLVVWQTGSGTQTNMNVNEVIANRANEILGYERGSKHIHPNDHVNCGQSSNDSFPTAMHIAIVTCLQDNLFPALKVFFESLDRKATDFSSIIKIARTHLQDATPMTVGQEFSGYATQIKFGRERVEACLDHLLFLAQGGTAVGTGLNCKPGFVDYFIKGISNITGLPFKTAPNKFEALASRDAVVFLSGALNTLAVSCMKIANDMRLLGSGPRCGLGELILPANEPGSSIMPGKINPTQTEAMTMVCAQVMGNHTTITVAGSQGHLELNVFKPVLIYNILQSINLLSDAINSFVKNCINDLSVNTDKLNYYVKHSLMLVTALNPHIGYDNAALVAKKAYAENISLQEATVALGFLTAEEFAEKVRPEKMVDN